MEKVIETLIISDEKAKGFVDVISQDKSSRYKLGIIDFLTKYSGMKMLENEIKSTVYKVNKNEISAID